MVNKDGILSAKNIIPSYAGKGYQNLEINQFTGMLDKYGVEVYEGDIISWCNKGTDWRAKVVYSSEEGNFLALFNDGVGEPLNKDLEVIGNIYENKELLND